MSNSEEKKLGGIYTIEDLDLRARMIKESTEGERCTRIQDFMSHVFSEGLKTVLGNRPQEIEYDGYMVCFMPGMYEHDIANAIGAASPMDAAKLYAELIAEGFTMMVWDGRTRKFHAFSWNEYIGGDGDE